MAWPLGRGGKPKGITQKTERGISASTARELLAAVRMVTGVMRGHSKLSGMDLLRLEETAKKAEKEAKS
jgi:hypothetical protein